MFKIANAVVTDEYVSALAVVAVAALTGARAAAGMSALQWTGGVAAVAAAIAWAVIVRVWPMPSRARAKA